MNERDDDDDELENGDEKMLRETINEEEEELSRDEFARDETIGEPALIQNM